MQTDTSRKVRLLPSLLMLVTICLLAYSVLSMGRYGEVDKLDAGNTNSLRIDPRYLNFGEVWVSRQFVWGLRLFNSGEKDVTVAEVRANCSCTSVSPKSFTIDAAGTVELEITVDLFKKGLDLAGQTSREVSIDLLPIDVRGKPLADMISIQGTVRTPINIMPGSVEFPLNSLIKGMPYKPAIIKLTDLCQLTGLKVDCPESVGKAAILEGVSAESGVHLISVSPVESLPPGEFEFELSVSATTNDGSVVQLPVPVRGCILRDVQADVKLLSISSSNNLGNSEVDFLIKSRSSRPFDVTGWEWSHGADSVQCLKCDATPIASHEHVKRVSCTFRKLTSAIGIGKLLLAVRERPTDIYSYPNKDDYDYNVSVAVVINRPLADISETDRDHEGAVR